MRINFRPFVIAMKLMVMSHLVSCNVLKSITNGKTEIKDDFFEKEFIEARDGSYITGCISDGSGLDYQTQVFNSNGFSTITTNYYGDGLGCSSTLYADEVVTGYYYGGYGETILEIESRDLTSRVLATSFNSTVECGFNDWVDDSTKNILGVDCLGRTRTKGQKLGLETEYDEDGNVYIDGVFYQKI